MSRCLASLASLSLLFATLPAVAQTPDLVITPATVTVESGSTATLTVRPATRPQIALTFYNFQIADASVASFSDGSYSKQLFFDQSSWETPQTPTLSGVSAGQTSIGVLSTDGTYSATIPVNVTVAGARVTTSPARLSLLEDDSDGAAFSVVLDAAPTGNVTVSVTSNDTGAASVSTSSLIFTSSNWNTPRSVTVTPVIDDDNRDESLRVTLRVSGGGYDGIANKTVPVSITDNVSTVPAIVVSPTSLSLTEGGDFGTLSVSLDAPPPANVTVRIESDDEAGIDFGGSAVQLSPRTLTFTPTNWSVTQAVHVFPVEDNDNKDESLKPAALRPGPAGPPRPRQGVRE